MLNKLALRNAKRAWKDYATYFLTMCMISALMFAFNALLFSKDIYNLVHYENGSTAGAMLITFLIIATLIIIIIIAWLVNYMTHFMLEKRSREFAIYLLAGMKRNQISSLYMKENIMLGIFAFFLGLLLGSGLQQILFYIFYKSIGKNYHISMDISIGSLLLTIFLCGLCFLIALIKNKKKFSDMEIIQLMNMDKQNEEINEEKSGVLQWLFFISIGNIVLFYFLLITGHMTKVTIIFEIVGLILSIYFFYLGISALLIKYVNNKGKLIYKKENVFLIRQFSSKLKNTCFTLGTLSLLFTLSLSGGALAFMLSDYQGKQLDVEYPFDIIILSENKEDTFEKEKKLIQSKVDIKDQYMYNVYENGTNSVRNYLFENLRVFKDNNLELTEQKRDIAYYDYDVYMKITDYNYLRKMLGYSEVILEENEYMIHMPDRVYREVKDSNDSLEKKININLLFKGIQTEGFAQAGHNGADYIVIVPDNYTKKMNKYFSLYAMMTKGEAPENLSDMLYQQSGKIRGFDEIIDYIKIGTEELFLTPATIQVKNREVTELRFLMSTLSFPLFYVGLVFLCISMTVLSIQQLSDANKHKFRYQILNKIGMRKSEIRFVVVKQLFLYYICPVLLAALISAMLILSVSRRFVLYTGISTGWLWYFVISIAVFLGIYTLYFIVTLLQFINNIEKNNI